MLKSYFIFDSFINFFWFIFSEFLDKYQHHMKHKFEMENLSDDWRIYNELE